jgi:hypothetical protein
MAALKYNFTPFYRSGQHLIEHGKHFLSARLLVLKRALCCFSPRLQALNEWRLLNIDGVNCAINHIAGRYLDLLTLSATARDSTN